MDPNELVERIRNGDADAAVSEFLNQTPGMTLETLAVMSFQWQVLDVSEALLHRILREQPDNVGAHKHLAAIFYATHRFKDSTPHLEFAVRHLPQDAETHSRLCWAYFAGRRLDDLRAAVKRAKASIPKGRHLNWQVGLTMKEHLTDDLLTRLAQHRDEAIGAIAAARRGAPAPKPSSPSGQPAHTGPYIPAFAKTGAATETGQTAATLSGQVAAGGRAAQFRFEFGEASDDLSRTTPWAPLPGRLNARFVNTPTWTPDRTWLYAGATSWELTPEPHLTLHWPFGQDPNHISGVGFMELIYASWHNSCQFDGFQEVRPWECSDLSGAEVRIRYRTRDFEPGDGLHCIGIGAVNSYWMLSGEAAHLSAGEDGRFREIAFQLSADPGQWTFAGSNAPEQENHQRYSFSPLHGCLSRNTGNLVLVAPFGAATDITHGELDIAWSSVTYRDMNVLHPDYGARLVATEGAGECDPGNLVNGIYGDPDSGWFRPGNGAGKTPTFTWQLAEPATVATLVLTQDPVMPAARCRLTITDTDGEALTREIEMASDYQEVVRLEKPLLSTAVTLEILSGKSSTGVGLQSLQVFAVDFVPPPTPDPATVSAHAEGLSPGAQVYYRAVCRSANGEICHGDVRQMSLPSTPAPILHGIEFYTGGPEISVFQVRLNAMGAPTTLHWRVDDGPWRERDAGWEVTPAHRYLTVRGLPPGGHRLSVRLTSARGRSPEQQVDWTIAAAPG